MGCTQTTEGQMEKKTPSFDINVSKKNMDVGKGGADALHGKTKKISKPDGRMQKVMDNN